MMKSELFINNITQIDCARYDNRYGLVGESWNVNIIIGGDIKDNFLIDFSLAKKEIKKIIDSVIDHKFMVPAGSLKQHINYVSEFNTKIPYEITYIAPTQTFVEILYDGSYYNLEKTLGQVILTNIKELFPNINTVTVYLNESGPYHQESFYYHYTHGLKFHNGPCQRLLHGHHSYICIRNQFGHKIKEKEKEIYNFFNYKHLVCQDDIKSCQNGMIKIEYNTFEGFFSLTLPESKCIIMPYETTVENISKYISDKVTGPVIIDVYEGINKGYRIEKD